MYDNGSINITSLNPSYLVEGKYTVSSKSYSKLINYGAIIVYNLFEINYGGYLENGTKGIIIASIFRLLNYFEPNIMKFFKSSIVDNNEFCITYSTLSFTYVSLCIVFPFVMGGEPKLPCWLNW